MALTTPRGFMGGPMADIDYGMMSARAAWVEEASHLLVTQPNTGTRTISIAVGVADGFGIRVTNDAALTQALVAPSSGSAWYLIALRRDWSARTATLQVLPGPTAGDTAAPSVVPTTLPATFQSTPGTQADQQLAWVWVSSASTTLVLFDVRVQDTRGRGLQVPNLHALATLALSTLRLGSGLATKVTVGPHTLAGEQVQAIDAIGNGFGGFVLTSRVFTGGTVNLAGSLAALKALLLAYGGNTGLVGGEQYAGARAGLMMLDTVTGIDYAWGNGDWLLWSGDATPYAAAPLTLQHQGPIAPFSGANYTRARRSGNQVSLVVAAYLNGQALTAGTKIAVLPPGFRPTLQVPFTVIPYGGNYGGTTVANMTVEPDGSIYWQGGANPGVGGSLLGAVTYAA